MGVSERVHCGIAACEDPQDPCGKMSHEAMPPQSQPLPDGWVENYEPTAGVIYYFNTSTQESQWERPAAPYPAPDAAYPSCVVCASAVQESAPPLPEGWVARFHEAYGVEYYFNLVHSCSQWDRPTAPAESYGAAQVASMVTMACGTTVADGAAPIPYTEDTLASAHVTRLAQAAEAPLPVGWVARFDETYRIEYYFDLVHSCSQWARPTAPPDGYDATASGAALTPHAPASVSVDAAEGAAANTSEPPVTWPDSDQLAKARSCWSRFAPEPSSHEPPAAASTVKGASLVPEEAPGATGSQEVQAAVAVARMFEAAAVEAAAKEAAAAEAAAAEAAAAEAAASSSSIGSSLRGVPRPKVSLRGAAAAAIVAQRPIGPNNPMPQRARQSEALGKLIASSESDLAKFDKIVEGFERTVTETKVRRVGFEEKLSFAGRADSSIQGALREAITVCEHTGQDMREAIDMALRVVADYRNAHKALLLAADTDERSTEVATAQLREASAEARRWLRSGDVVVAKGRSKTLDAATAVQQAIAKERTRSEAPPRRVQEARPDIIKDKGTEIDPPLHHMSSRDLPLLRSPSCSSIGSPSGSVANPAPVPVRRAVAGTAVRTRSASLTAGSTRPASCSTVSDTTR